jgi:hypothetical protein
MDAGVPRPRQFIAPLLPLSSDKREAWIAANVPADLQAMVRAQLQAAELSITRFTLYVAKGATLEIRRERLAWVPVEIRPHVQIGVVEIFRRRGQSRTREALSTPS